MLIKELSLRSGLSPHTIRFYERAGLIKGRRDEKVTSNNYYHYDEETVEKLEFINDAKSVGFTISEIGLLIDTWYNDKFNKKKKLSILETKLESLKQKEKEIKNMIRLIGKFKDDILNDRC